MLKIRLTRLGARKRPFYRVVVVDERNKRDSAYIELLGTYNPLTEPKEIKLKQDRIDHWIKQGAQMSTGFLRIIGKAPQRKPRKAKKVKEEKPAAPVPTPEATPAEVATTEKATEEVAVAESTTPAEESAPAAAEVTEQIAEDSAETTTEETQVTTDQAEIPTPEEADTAKPE